MSAPPDPHDDEPADGEPAPSTPEEDNLTQLRARLDELQETVRQLGSEDQPAPRVESAPAHRPYEPAPAEPEQEPYEPLPEDDDPLTYPAPPAATNGHTTATVDPAEISALSSTVAIVDAGPFADLIELRHFEDDLAALAAVRDVRVRRFGQGRATIEVGMTGAYELGHELYQLNRPMEIGDGPEGQVVIELEPLPAPESEADADGDETGGGDD